MEQPSPPSCYVCDAQKDVKECNCPVYLPSTDTVKIALKPTCSSCDQHLRSIEIYVQKNSLSYCNYDFTSPTVNSLEKVDLKAFEKGKQGKQTFVQCMLRHFETSQLTRLSTLPKPVLLLVHLSWLKTQEKAPQERHNKVFNLVAYLAQQQALSVEQMPHALVVIHVLLCHMDAHFIYPILRDLSLLTLCRILNWEDFTTNLQVDTIWPKIEAALALQNCTEEQILSAIEKVGTKSLTKVGKGDKHIDRTERAAELRRSRIEQNNLGLLLRAMHADEQILKKQRSILQQRQEAEKKEFVNKIVKLTNKIEELESELIALKEEMKRGPKEGQGKQVDEIKKGQKEADKKKVETGNQCQLQSIITLTQLFSWNSKDTVSFGSNSSALQEQIIEEINKLIVNLQKTTAKCKASEEEKARLIGILGRKEERYISLIHEKDVIIDKYESALWRMENGLEVEEEPLCHRIRYIIALARKETKSPDRASKKKEPSSERHIKKDDKCRIY